jgi:RNA polymerase sigma-70 factor (ECF subfamily)
MEDGLSSDTELMARLGQGDLAALGTLAQRHQSRVLSLSYRLLGDWHRAEDVSQETFLRLRQAAHTYEPKAKFTTWLYRIVHNLSMDQQRKAMNAPVSLEALHEDKEEAAQDSPVERRELAEMVRHAVGELPERQRHVIILHRYEGLSHEEICEVTGWSKSAVESLLVRAYENLRKKLASYQDFSH